MSTIVRAMDDVLDENLENHALPEQRECAKKWRNIGIGVMGVHDALIKLGIVYGSKDSLRFIELVMPTILHSALFTSSALGEEKGSFPGYSPKIWDSTFLNLTLRQDDLLELKKRNTLRNCALLSVAPTGSIGTMWNVSTGVEPFYSTTYMRKTVSLEGEEQYHSVDVPVIEEAKRRNWHPETWVTALDISGKQHIDAQSSFQRWVDASISKTINLSSETTPEEIESLYKYAWEQGLKGCTIYVEGSRDPILSTSIPSSREALESIENELKMDFITPLTRDELGEVLSGSTFKYKTACGTLYITVNKDQNGNIVEIFTNSSKNGTCKANLNGETRMASLALRAGVKVEEVIDQLKGIHCQSCAFARAKGNAIDGTSCPDIIAKCILSSYKSKDKKAYIPPVTKIESREVCPECGQPLRHEGGCVVCSCGFSRCG